MKREIEKNKTYRIPHKNGTDLLQIVSLDPFRVKNLKSGKTESMDKQSFQERLNKGEIYVSARNSNTNQIIITVLRKLIAATTTGISDVHLTEYVKKQMDKLEKKNKPVFDKTTSVIQLLRENFKHPILETHEYKSGKGPSGEKLLRSVISKSMGGWRLHWYKPKNTSNTIVIIDIIKHG